MRSRWCFHAVCATNAFGFTWHWQCRRPDGSTSRSRVPFDYYYDCIEDARKQGYRGPLPPGPKVALSALPGGSGGAAAVARRAQGLHPGRAAQSHSPHPRIGAMLAVEPLVDQPSPAFNALPL